MARQSFAISTRNNCYWVRGYVSERRLRYVGGPYTTFEQAEKAGWDWVLGKSDHALHVNKTTVLADTLAHDEHEG